MPKHLLSAILLLFLYTALYAQPEKIFSSKSYKVDEGLLVNRIVDIAEDNNGFIWVSSGVGLQKFDGTNFETIPPQNNLSETNHPHFFKLKDGTLWISYYYGISAYNSISNRFESVYQNNNKGNNQINEAEEYQASPVMPEIECGDVVWCWSFIDAQFIAINKKTYKVTDTLRLPAVKTNYITAMTRGTDGNLFFFFNNGIAQLNFITKQFYFFSVAKKPFAHFTVLNNKVFAFTTHGMYKIDVIKGNSTLLNNYPSSIHIDSTSWLSINYLYDNLFTISINAELYVIDLSNGKFLYHMVNQQSKPFIDPGYINFCMMDHSQHLWVVSLVAGLNKVNFNKSRIKYFGVRDMQKNFTRCIYPDKKANLVIAGNLFNGVSVFDTAGHILKQFSIPPHTAAVQVSCILKIAPFKYLLFLPGKYSVYLLDAVKWKITPELAYPPIDYYSTVQPLNDSEALLINSTVLGKIHFKNQQVKLEPLITNRFSLCGLLSRQKQMWLGSTGKYFILSGKNLEKESVFSLKENVVTKCLYEDRKGNMWMGTEQGLYKLNANTGAIVYVYKKADGLVDENIYSIQADEQSNIWFSTNKGISCLTMEGKIINIYASDGIQGSEFNGNSSAKADDGELFFGGLNGFNSFYPDILKSIDKEPKILMSDIKVMDEDWHGDTASWNLSRIILPYTQNIISFEFTAIGWYDPAVYNYQYKMVGMDKNWVNAHNNGEARYVLPPGNYTFEYAAATRFDRKIASKKFIYITITPPYWQTTLFKAFMIILVVLILIAAVFIYAKQKYKKQLRLINIQKSIQEERQRISRDLHDNIGAYTTVLIANTEQLNKKTASPEMQQTAQKIADNAKNIIGSLQETIWVLNNDAITITDFADRFKLYAKKIFHNFPDIQIKFQEQLSNDIILTPTEALNIFRIMQEALQNALKHGNPRNVTISIISSAEMRIFIKDDGTGYNTTSVTNGNGLYNMKYRAMEVGYELDMFSDNNGTIIKLHKNDSFAV